MGNPLDAGTEFGINDGVAEAEAAKAAAEKAEAERAKAEQDKADLTNKVGGLEKTLSEKVAELDGLKSKTAILDRMQEIFGGKQIDPKDQFVTDEIRRRLGGDLSDLNKIKQMIPVLLEMVGATVEEKQAERVESAQESLRSAMEKEGLDVKDEETFGAMEEAVTSVIRRDEKLAALWQKGQTKKAVSEAFERLSGKLYAPVRARIKRSAVNTTLDGPKPSPRGGAASAPASKGTNTVDVRDTSRAGITKVHDAAFERLQELMGDN